MCIINTNVIIIAVIQVYAWEDRRSQLNANKLSATIHRGIIQIKQLFTSSILFLVYVIIHVIYFPVRAQLSLIVTVQKYKN